MGIDINNNKNVVCFSECAKCVESKGTLTCCGKGGSWRGKCGPVGDPNSEHSWAEGLRVCAPPTTATASEATTSKATSSPPG